MNKITSIALVTCCLIASPLALSSAPNLTFVEVNYTSFEDEELESTALDFRGFEINASYALNENFYIPVSYFSVSDDTSSFTEDSTRFNNVTVEYQQNSDIDLTQTLIGIGYALPTSGNGFFYGEFGYLKVDLEELISWAYQDSINGEAVESGRFSRRIDVSGQYIEAGYQHKFNNGFQTSLSALHRRLSNNGQALNETSAYIEVLYNINDNFALKAAYESSDGRLALGARYNF